MYLWSRQGAEAVWLKHFNNYFQSRIIFFHIVYLRYWTNMGWHSYSPRHYPNGFSDHIKSSLKKTYSCLHGARILKWKWNPFFYLPPNKYFVCNILVLMVNVSKQWTRDFTLCEWWWAYIVTDPLNHLCCTIKQFIKVMSLLLFIALHFNDNEREDKRTKTCMFPSLHNRPLATHMHGLAEMN